MTNDIYPCLWFNGQAKEAAEFYCSVFDNSKITTDTPMVVLFEIEGKKIMGLNGGPMFTITPAISLFVSCESEQEINDTWKKLSEGGTAMMALDKYPWAEKYGWVKDKFGMTWQLMLTPSQVEDQKIKVSFLFVGEQFGKAKQAVEEYTSLFPGSSIQSMNFYEAGEGAPQMQGTLKFGTFTLKDVQFAAMDGFGNHEFSFTEGLSIVVDCETQDEIDLYWNKLTEGGAESMCGWLKDKYGVSWQIIPKVLGRLMTDPKKGENVMKELMKMKKLDIAKLENA
jgi:predicted 3-demethylubiquinone-9 3-methyltransferase (glyoxalase superfamily)